MSALRWATRSITSATRSPQRETPAGRRAFGAGAIPRQRRAVVFFEATIFFFAVVVFFLAEADLLLDDFLALTFAFADFEDRAVTFVFADFEDRAVAFAFAEREARADLDERAERARRLRAERERVYTGRFQPTARSARNDAGMLRMPVCESVTASAAASARSARTSLITFAGRRALAA